MNKPNDSDNSNKSKLDIDPYWDPWRAVQGLKYMGYSLDDIRHMTMTTAMFFSDYHALAMGSSETEQSDPDLRPGERWATQADYHNFF